MKYNELTWEDINTIEKLINCVQYEYRNGLGDESFGKEVLKRFLKIKNDGSSEKPNNHEGLEDASEKHASMHPLCNGKPAKNSFIAGAEWAFGQGVSFEGTAIEILGRIKCDGPCNVAVPVSSLKGVKDKDRVIVQIRKK